MSAPLRNISPQPFFVRNAYRQETSVLVRGGTKAAQNSVNNQDTQVLLRLLFFSFYLIKGTLSLKTKF